MRTYFRTIFAVAGLAALGTLGAVQAAEAPAAATPVEVIVVTAKRESAVEVIVVTARRPQVANEAELIASARHALSASAVDIVLPEIDVRGVLTDRTVAVGVVSVRL